MIINELAIEGAFLVKREPNRDERGYFAIKGERRLM